VRQQGPADGKYEVTVVDNGSSDYTKQVVDSLQRQFTYIKYVYEQRLGLSAARNAGARLSEGEVICFLDDDTIPCTNYISEILQPFRHRDVACVGGKIIASWPDGCAPRWFPAKYANVVGQTSFGEKSRFMEKYEFPFGGNIAFRRKLFEKHGGFDENLGRKGQDYLCGEEIDLCYKLQAEGLRFFYNPRAAVSHIVGRKRANKSYFVKSIFGKGVTEGHQKLTHRGAFIFAMYLVLKACLLGVASLFYLSACAFLSEATRFKFRCKIAWYAGYLYFLACRDDFGSISRT
jgi:cellulose synthase/poly-beta-1,6-N-acetylglucosamine synthase-like glycosyltransferase